MNPIFQHLIVERVKKQIENQNITPTPKQFEREVYKAKVEVSHLIKDGLLILLGVLAASFGLKGFLHCLTDFYLLSLFIWGLTHCKHFFCCAMTFLGSSIQG